MHISTSLWHVTLVITALSTQVMLFPQLQLSLQRDVAAAVLHHAPEDKRVTLANNQLAPRKIRVRASL